MKSKEQRFSLEKWYHMKVVFFLIFSRKKKMKFEKKEEHNAQDEI